MNSPNVGHRLNVEFPEGREPRKAKFYIHAEGASEVCKITDGGAWYRCPICQKSVTGLRKWNYWPSEVICEVCAPSRYEERVLWYDQQGTEQYKSLSDVTGLNKV